MSLFIAIAGCSEAQPDSGFPSGLTQAGASGTTEGPGEGEVDETGPRLDVAPGGSHGGRDPDDPRDLPTREEECDANGVCTCLRLALLGTLETAANDSDTRPFVAWLNDNSGGSAKAEMITTKPTLDDTWLAQYDILVIANVNGWTFGTEEKAALERWVRTTGGGIVALTGFVSTDTEPAATSQLIEWSGLRFTGPQKTAENGQQIPVYYEGDTTTDLKNCLAWTGSSDAIITAPISFSPQTGQLAKLTYALDYVGAFIGWGVETRDGATVVATDPVTGRNIAVAYEVDGKGRIFAFGDEWVLLANQWQPTGSPHNMQQDQYNPCWHAAEGTEPGFFHSVATLYQTKQFWFDAINWVAPPNECFVIEDPGVQIP